MVNSYSNSVDNSNDNSVNPAAQQVTSVNTPHTNELIRSIPDIAQDALANIPTHPERERLELLEKINQLRRDLSTLEQNQNERITVILNKILSDTTLTEEEQRSKWAEQVNIMDQDPQIGLLHKDLSAKLEALKKTQGVLKGRSLEVIFAETVTRLSTMALKGQDLPGRVTIKQGLVATAHTIYRARAAVDLYESVQTPDAHVDDRETLEKDLKGLERIARHRSNLGVYGAKELEIQETLPVNPKEAEKKVNDLRDEIQQNVKELENPNSKKTTVLADGTRSFSIPGGWSNPTGGGHAILYEFQRKIDENGQVKYSFIIHNRGNRSPDRGINRMFHGDDDYEKDGKTYSKTRVEIEVSSEALQDKDFLDGIIRRSVDITTHSDGVTPLRHPYIHIHEFLIKSNGGKVVKSAEETLREKLMGPDLIFTDAEKGKIYPLRRELMSRDPNFHSEQLWGTCTDSNLTGVEKDMAQPNTHRILKRYVVSDLHNTAEAENMANPVDSTQTVLELSVEKIISLSEKIRNPLLQTKPPKVDIQSEIREFEEIVRNQSSRLDDQAVFDEKMSGLPYEVQDVTSENFVKYYINDTRRIIKLKNELLLMKQKAEQFRSKDNEKANSAISSINQMLASLEGVLSLIDGKNKAEKSLPLFINKFKEWDTKMQKLIEKSKIPGSDLTKEVTQLRKEGFIMKQLAEFHSFTPGNLNKMKAITHLVDKRIGWLDEWSERDINSPD